MLFICIDEGCTMAVPCTRSKSKPYSCQLNFHYTSILSHLYLRLSNSVHNCSFPVQDMLNVSTPSIHLSSVAGDNITWYDSIVFDGEEVGSRTNLSVSDGLMASDDCHTDCTAVEAPLQSFSGYVGVQYRPPQ